MTARRPLALLSDADAPLRQPSRETRRPDIRIEAGRQLRASLWLVLLTGVGLAVTMASRPPVQAEPATSSATVPDAPVRLTLATPMGSASAIR